MGFFQIPLDLPHAGTIAERIVMVIQRSLDEESEETETLTGLAGELFDLLWPHRMNGENPNMTEALLVREEAARLGRLIVDEIERLQIGNDRLGQCVRNLFECLELGREGAEISLRAGEDPDSFQRP